MPKKLEAISDINTLIPLPTSLKRKKISVCNSAETVFRLTWNKWNEYTAFTDQSCRQYGEKQ